MKGEGRGGGSGKGSVIGNLLELLPRQWQAEEHLGEVILAGGEGRQPCLLILSLISGLHREGILVHEKST